MNLFETGTYHRRPDGYGNSLVADQKAAGIRWALLNMGVDVNRDPTVWNAQRRLYRDAQIPHGPWLHCRSMEDVNFVLTIARAWSSELVGVNLEDVVSDNLSLEAVGRVLSAVSVPVHIATLPWVQNSQGWQHVAEHTLALEMFPKEGQGQKYLDEWQKCVDHAFAEGAKKVTLLFSTTSPRSAYPDVAHCLYTADDVTGWSAWEDSVPQPVPVPPKPEVPVSNVPYPRPLTLGDVGIDVEGLGRALCKTGFYVTLTQFGKASQKWRRTYGQGKVDAVNKLRAQAGWKRTGQYNLAVHDLMERKGFFDARAIDLISQYKPPPPPDPVRIRAAMSDFCRRAEGHEGVWHYTQNRPFTGYGNAPEATHYADCSAYCSLVYFWAKQETGLKVPDPTGYNFSGYGNTWDDLDGHPRVSSPYQVGDLAHWEGHVAVCRKPGSTSEAVFSSFGREAGPNPVNLNYRSDLRFVCRPPFA